MGSIQSVHRHGNKAARVLCFLALDGAIPPARGEQFKLHVQWVGAVSRDRMCPAEQSFVCYLRDGGGTGRPMIFEAMFEILTSLFLSVTEREG